MIRKIRNAIAAGLATIAIATPVAAQEPEEPKRIELGYNALQAGATTDGDLRSRLYTNVTLNAGPVRAFVQGLNEASTDRDGDSPSYAFGWNTLGIGLQGAPVSAIYTTRLVNDDGDITKLDEALGIRVDIGALPGIHYGNLDLVKNTGAGLEGYDGKELSVFAGREFGGMAIEGLVQVGESGRRYAEIEFLGPTKEHVRPYARVEFPDGRKPIGIVGVQLQK